LKLFVTGELSCLDGWGISFQPTVDRSAIAYKMVGNFPTSVGESGVV